MSNVPYQCKHCVNYYDCYPLCKDNCPLVEDDDSDDGDEDDE